ncbi:hypothetical protein [Streptomyces sp. NPDC012825]|uniref:hypothetical protein n=1 Tax=Streptomyces sp. NPDC012825 TaxID=3364851 RepID=UPI003677F9B1
MQQTQVLFPTGTEARGWAMSGTHTENTAEAAQHKTPSSEPPPPPGFRRFG